MLFNLQEDHGTRISVYVVPDSGGSVPSVRVRSDGRDLLVLAANEHIPALVQAGRHTTGLCGFVIDEILVPGLGSYADLEITEAETGVLVYRRAIPQVIPDMNLFRLEAHLLPLWRIDDALKLRFN